MGLASLWMIFATAVLNLSMAGFHRVMSQGLGPDYAELAALIALANVLGVLTQGISTNLVKVFADDVARGGRPAAKGRLLLLQPIFLKFMLGAALFLALLAWPTVSFLKLQSPVPYLMLALSLVVSLPLLLVRAQVQGTLRFGVLGSSLAAEGLGRLGFALLVVAAGLGVTGAFEAALVGQLVGFSLCVGAIWSEEPASKVPEQEIGKDSKELWRDISVLGLFSLLCFLDVLTVKHRFDEVPAAMYSRAALVAKSFLYLASALNMVLLPEISLKRREGIAEAQRVLLRFLAAAFGIELLGLAMLWALTPLVIRILCGSDPGFLDLVPLVRGFSAAVVPLALSQLVIYYLLAMRDYRIIWVLGGVLLAYMLGLFFWGADAGSVVLDFGLANAALLLFSMLLALRPSPTPKIH